MRILYPSDPFNKKEPDEAYEEEFIAAQKVGLLCSIFSVEDFELGDFNPRPMLVSGDEILYRGWMLTSDRYKQLQHVIEAKGSTLVTTLQQYLKCHYLPEWYAQCEDITPKTIFLTKNDDFATALSRTGWSAYFVKDYVKSLTTSRGSVARNANEVREIVGLIEKYRGQIEGGICIRELEDIQTETEERYFVFRGEAFAREGVVSDFVTSIARRIDSPFFSLDIVFSSTGVPRLMELGDGQVSDRKKWPAARFVEVLYR